MFNEASLPEDEAWTSLTRDLTESKKARNEAERQNLYVPPPRVSHRPRLTRAPPQPTPPRARRGRDPEPVVRPPATRPRRTLIPRADTPRSSGRTASSRDRPLPPHVPPLCSILFSLCDVFCSPVRICTLYSLLSGTAAVCFLPRGLSSFTRPIPHAAQPTFPLAARPVVLV